MFMNRLINRVAEGAGFEPANLSVNGFQDRRHRPLGHPSGHFLILSGRRNPVNAPHVRPQGLRDEDAAIGLLIVLHDSNRCSSRCQS